MARLKTVQTAASAGLTGTSTADLPSTPALPADPIPVIKNSIKQIELRKTPRGAINSICQLNLLSARANGGERRVPD